MGGWGQNSLRKEPSQASLRDASSPEGGVLGIAGNLPTKLQVCGRTKAFPWSGEGGCERSEQTDEGAGKQQLTANYPSSGATRHLPPKG